MSNELVVHVACMLTLFISVFFFYPICYICQLRLGLYYVSLPTLLAIRQRPGTLYVEHGLLVVIYRVMFDKGVAVAHAWCIHYSFTSQYSQSLIAG
jgi:hypothetical protein